MLADPSVDSVMSLPVLLWQAFEKASALSNFVTLTTGAISLAGTIRVFVHQAVRNEKILIQSLEKDRARRDVEIGLLNQELDALKKTYQSTVDSLPESALSKA